MLYLLKVKRNEVQVGVRELGLATNGNQLANNRIMMIMFLSMWLHDCYLQCAYLCWLINAPQFIVQFLFAETEPTCNCAVLRMILSQLRCFVKLTGLVCTCVFVCRGCLTVR